MPVFRSVVALSAPSINGGGTNTWHFRTTSEDPINNRLLLQIASDSLQDFYNIARTLTPGGTVFNHDGVWQEVGTLTPTRADVTGWSVAADTGGAAAASATAICITWRTALSNRRGRGRTFISPCRQDSIEGNGTPTEGTRNVALNAAQTLIGPFGEPGDGAFVVWSEVDQVGRDFVAASTANKFAVLTSRRD